MGLIWLRKCRYWYRQMIAHDYPIEQSNGRVATNAQTSGWHLWTVIIPRRSISGKLVSGQVWRRRHGAKWAYTKFVEYADRDITGAGARHESANPVTFDYDMVKPALNSVDPVILRSFGPGDETQARRRLAAAGLDLTRARDCWPESTMER